MGLPLFNVFEYPNRPQLYQSLQAAGPARAWEIMRELEALHRPIYRAEIAEFEAETTASISGYMDLAPALDDLPKTKLVEQAVGYGPKLMFESTFLTLWMNNTRTLFDDVVEIVGREELDRARELNRGVLMLPLHLGPSYAIGPILAHLMPTRVVFNRMNFHEIQEFAFPDLPISGFQLEESSAFREGISALRENKAFSMFPELDPRGIDRHHIRLEFLGTTVLAPTGPMLISHVAKAPILPVELTANGEGRFILKFHPMLDAPEKRDDVLETTKALWKTIHDAILAGPIGEWEMWHEFDRMQPDIDGQVD